MKDFDRILMVRKQRYNMSKFTICLEFSSTKMAKAYLINYILDTLQENVGNICVLCSLSSIDNVRSSLKLINCQYFKGILFK